VREFVRSQTDVLLRRLAVQADRAAASAEEAAIHDLRVAIRRLSRCLRVFAAFYPGRSWKDLRRRLRSLMEACAAVRDRDIAIALLTESGVAPGSPLLTRLHAERHGAQSGLRRKLRSWKDGAIYQRWQARLEL
jgi:CHAD domain-containing protein